MNIIVTGASNGIGHELVRLFASNTNNKVVALARNRLKLEQLKRECLYQYPGAKIYPMVFDLGSGDFERAFVREILSYINTIDILVNNAGMLINKPFEELTAEDVDSVYRTNITSVFSTIRMLLPYMGKAETPTHIVNISSMGGIQGSAKFPGLSAYSSSKAALVALTECLAEEFKGRNIAINCLALGAVQTEMFSKAFPGEKVEMQPMQMAHFVRDFALSGAAYFNGKVLPVSNTTP